MKYLISILIPLFCLISCNENKTQAPQQDSVTLDAPKDSISEKDLAKRAVKYGVYQWNVANNKWDTATLRTLIAPKTKMYGKKMTTNEACTFLYERFKQYSHYAQKVARDFEMESISDTKIKASFIRIIDWGEQKTELPTYLIFEKIGEKWLIVEECSAEKFAKKEETNENNVVQMKFENCDELCESIIKSTSIYKFFLKSNPSAFFAQNKSEFSFHHDNKEGHEFLLKSNGGKAYNSILFVVYPQKAKLSAYDAVKEKEVFIPFEDKFVPYFKKMCGGK